MVKLVMLISGGLVWTVLISAVFGHAPWNRTFGPDDVGKEQIWEHRNRNFSQYRPGAGSYQNDYKHQHGPWSWNEYRPHHRPPLFNLEESTTVVWPNLDQGSETTTSKFVPLINMRPALGSSSISQSSPVLNSTEKATTTRRPNLTQDVSLQVGNVTSGSTAGLTTTTPKSSIQHNSDDDYDWSALGLEDEEAVQNRMSGTKSVIDRLRCRKCRQRKQKNFG
ncbi:uncharacterized protein LOC119765192 isoform X2 [Culex quinquefasciatus]|uniref:uncharacterized protein LOC119765192 isoform X2 n=1 Tax=Culex quinquefasciatus TaxID=7176 RepID=UPI0018E3E761|nr:uncharacterized protein LOC119765192 isoform X2 [Culex quinquefasciatus]